MPLFAPSKVGKTNERTARDLKARRESRLLLSLGLFLIFSAALAIRLTNLATKPAWMDEVATVLFSLGNYSRQIPLNEIISLEQVLRPLQLTPSATASDAIAHLLAEDNHPPTYFVLAHWWMAIFHHFAGNTAPEYASLWAARALPALLGALSVPAIYLLAWLSFRSSVIGFLSAVLMAVSPFSVFLSQEARHYTLAILAAIASLCCFVQVARVLQQRRAPRWRVISVWIAINLLGLTVHYFFGLTVLAEGLTLLVMLVRQCRGNRAAWQQRPWVRVYSAGAGTLAGTLLWLPVLTNFYGSPQTSFLRAGSTGWQYWINPIVQSLAGWLYAIMSPITRGYSWYEIAAIVATCILFLGVYTAWLSSHLLPAIEAQFARPSLRPGMQAIGGFFIISNGIFLSICYGLGFDITRGHRYSFVFFPSILLMVAAGLAPFWLARAPSNGQPCEQVRFGQVKLPFGKRTIGGRAFVLTVICVAFIGAQIIVNNFSSLKFYRPERLIGLIQAESTWPVVIGAETTITEQPSVIGLEIMSVAWEIQRSFNPHTPSQGWVAPPRFAIAENNTGQKINARAQLIRSLAEVSRPFDLWLLDFSPNLDSANCTTPTGGNKGSFTYTHYLCKRR